MVRLLKRPTTAPPMAAMTKRAELAAEGVKVRLLIWSSKVRRR